MRLLKLPRPWNPAFQETYDAMTPLERHWSAVFDLVVLFVGLAVIFASSASAQTFPDRGRAAVVDAAGVIPDIEEIRLNERVADWVNANGPQLAVVTVPSLEGRDVADYSNRLFRKWGLGQGRDSSAQSNGVLLLLAPAERKVRIEVGYGLEPVLTDALTSEIIRGKIVPQLKAGDIPAALADGADAIMNAATPRPEALVASPAQGSTDRKLWPWLLGGFLAISAGLTALLVIVGSRRKAAREEAELAAERERARRTQSMGTNRARPSAFAVDPSMLVTPRRSPETVHRTRPASPPPPPAPAPSRRRDEDDYSSRSSFGSSYGSSSSDYGSSSSSSSYDSGSSSSGYDSGGGSSGGGGSDSSY